MTAQYYVTGGGPFKFGSGYRVNWNTVIAGGGGGVTLTLNGSGYYSVKQLVGLRIYYNNGGAGGLSAIGSAPITFLGQGGQGTIGHYLTLSGPQDAG